MQFFRLQQGIGLISNSNIIGISGSSGGIGSTAKYSNNIVQINSRLEDSQEHIAQEFIDKSITHYIHLAAITDTEFCKNNPAECFLFNSEYAKKFYLAAINAKVKRFIFVSSSHIYDVNQLIPFDTSTPVRPSSVYGESKLLAEKEITSLDKHINLLSIARVFSVIGDNAKGHFLYQGLVKRAKKRDFSPIPGLHNIRDFLRASEVMSELIRLALSKEFPPLINICSGSGKSIHQIAQNVFSEHGLEDCLDQIITMDNKPPNSIVGVPTKFI